MLIIQDYKIANALDSPEGEANHCIIQTAHKAIFDDFTDQIIKDSLRKDLPVDKLDLGVLVKAYSKNSHRIQIIEQMCQKVEAGTLIVYGIDEAPFDIQHKFKYLIESGTDSWTEPDKFKGRFIFWSKDNLKIYDGLLTWITSAFFPDLDAAQTESL